LQTRNFQRDPDTPIKVERYQAEALVYQYVPIHALLGIVCHTQVIQLDLAKQAVELGLDLNILAKPRWYF
jgi:hypothetical protein